MANAPFDCAGLTEKDVQAFYSGVDRDGDGAITQDEFLQAAAERTAHWSQQHSDQQHNASAAAAPQPGSPRSTHNMDGALNC